VIVRNLLSIVTTGVGEQPTANGFACTTCHNDLTKYTLHPVVNVPFPSGKSLTFSKEKDEKGALKPVAANLCLECHQGRQSKSTIDMRVKGVEDDKIDTKITFANPHYFARDGQPIVFVTSDHHYGAVIDADFDFGRYLDTLAAGGMNLTRIYPGGMFEVEDKYVAGNPLGPRPGRQVLPWARSTVPGATLSSASCCFTASTSRSPASPTATATEIAMQRSPADP